MPNKERNIPKRRFKEFENADAWELRKIFEIADRFDNLRVPIASSLRVSGSTPYYGANGIQDYVEGYTHEGEFILVAEDGANDLKNYPVNLVNGKIWVNNHAHVLQGKKSIADNKFLAFSINQTNIESLLVGGGRAKLNSDVLMNIELKLPSPAEQEAIGNFFSTLDRHITLHQRKLDKLKSVKQAYLSEMFPAEGERVPKRRFPGFTDDWELRKLNNIADVRDGTHNSPRYIEFGYPLVTSKNIKNGQVNFEDIQYISSFDYEEINKRSKVNINDILMGMIGTVGNLALVREEPEFAIKNVALIKNIGVVNIEFLYHYLGSYVIERQLQNSLDGGTQKFISLNKIRHLDIAFPSLPEQKAIGTFFSTLDRQITLHQRKLEKLKNLKKALLNELFV
ncbi:TPA: restriction endonuclease subunit S [Streptococcus suis]|nr:restriction endonuclease subunit S [Streptococcus suis]